MNQKHFDRINLPKFQKTSILGLMLVVAGVLLLIDLRLKTQWLTISIPAILGLILLVYGLVSSEKGWLISGSLVTGTGLGLFFALQQLRELPLVEKFGYLTMFFAISWLTIFLILKIVFQNTAWWALICFAIFGGTAYALLFSPRTFLDFELNIILPLGLVFLVWGLRRKLVGLIIPGSILSTVAPGVYFAWNASSNPEGLTETGIMLVWFAFGWILITVFSRIIYKKFIWWPLIPGGVLAMVGWGLYIGGNPSNALGFVGNSGSIGLIIFGIYLLLLRFGIQK
jgi:hypothetical protein